MFPGFLNKLLKENRRQDEWKMVEVVDKNSGRVFQELLTGPIVDEMEAEGVVAQPLPEAFGVKSDGVATQTENNEGTRSAPIEKEVITTDAFVGNWNHYV